MATKTTTGYKSLLLDYVPRPIRNDRDLARVHQQIEKLMRKPNLPRAESEILEVLSTLVDTYETAEHPTPQVPPNDMLAHLIEVRGVTSAEVARQSSIPRSTISNVLAGRRALSTANIASLAVYFNVSPAVFITPVGASNRHTATKRRP